MPEPQDICYRAFELMRGKQYDDAEKLLSHWLTKTEDKVELGLFHSAYGVLEKTRGQFKDALRHYERAEKLIPDDPAIKLITARLLLDVYKEAGQTIRKCNKVLKLLPDNPVVVHHAKTLQGLAHAQKGSKRQAIAMLEESMAGDFDGFLTCDNIDFTLVEVCARKGWAIPQCRTFLDKALAFAKAHQEDQWVETVSKIVAVMPAKNEDSVTPR
jgi:tetratricopeptide (TPR) repeat protein